MNVIADATLEIRRVLSPRAWLATTIGVLLLAAATSMTYLATSRGDPDVAQVMRVASTGMVASVLGVVYVVADSRHGLTGRWVLLHRGRAAYVRAKFVAAGASGAALGLIALLTAQVSAIFGDAAPAAVADQAGSAATVLCVLSALAWLGAAIATIVPGVIAPFVCVLGIAPIVEASVTALDSRFGQWLPYSVANGLIAPEPGLNAISLAPGVLVLLAWGAMLSAVAIGAFHRRDLPVARR